MNAEYTKYLALLLLVAAVILTAGLGLRDPWPADEPRFALIAQTMAEGGNWLLPRVGGVVYPDKPPLFFWLVAALCTIGLPVKVAILVPGILSGLAVLTLVTDLARRLWDWQTGIWCGATLLALVQFPLQMKSGQIDALLCLWTTLGLYGLCRHLLLGPDWRWYAIGGLAAGLGVITKGVGVLPYLLFVPYLFAVRKHWAVYRHQWRDARWLLAPAATLAAIGAWLVPMLLVTSGSPDPDILGYRDNILFHQTVTRYADAWGHHKPFWYLLTNAVPWLWLPVSLLLPWLIVRWRHDLRQKDSAVLLLGSWVLLVLLFFSLSAGKRSLYIFPAAPAVALLAGYHMAALVRRNSVRSVLLVVSASFALVAMVAAMYLLMNPHEVSRWVPDVATIVKAAFSLLSMGILMLLATIFCRRRHAVAAFAATMSIVWLGYGLLIAPAMNAERSGHALMEQLGDALGPDDSLAFVDWPEQFLLQWDKPAVHFGFRRDDEAEMQDAVSWLSGARERKLLMPEFLLDECFDSGKARFVGRAHRRNWYLADSGAMNAGCDAAGQRRIFSFDTSNSIALVGKTGTP